MTYDPGSSGALSYLEAAREIALRAQRATRDAEERARERARRATVSSAERSASARGARPRTRADARPRRGSARGIPTPTGAGPPVDAGSCRPVAAEPRADATSRRRRAGTEPPVAGRVLRRARRSTRSRPNPRQPREVFDEDALAELVTLASARSACCSRSSSGSSGADRYELIMGERRWRACPGGRPRARSRRSSGPPTTTTLLRDALLENLHRAQLNPLEEAAAYDQLLRGLRLHPRRAGRPDRPLPPADLQHAAAAQAAAAGPAPGGGRGAVRRARPGPARRWTTPAEQERLAQRIVAEGLSVRAVEEIVALGGEPAAAGPRAPRASGRWPRARATWPTGSPTASRPG